MKYTTATRVLIGGYIENIELTLSGILAVCLAHRLNLSVMVTGDKYCIFGQVQAAVDN